jgi:phosphoribosylformylglycinamidine cyclo-ligase
MEIYLPSEYAQEVIDISQSFGIDAQVVGYVEKSDKTKLVIESEYGRFEY